MSETRTPRILGVVPARGGSRRLPRKNIRPLAGKPLIVWTIEAARQSRYLARLMVSTEDEEIARIAADAGCEVPFLRPRELAADDSSSVDVVLHVLDSIGDTFDYVMLLQPTSPLRTAQDIDACVQTCLREGASSCVSVTNPCKPLSFMRIVDEQNRLHVSEELFSQKAGRYCLLNGAIYLASVDLLRTKKTFYDADTVACFMPPERSLDIDEEHESIMAEALLANKTV